MRCIVSQSHVASGVCCVRMHVINVTQECHGTAGPDSEVGSDSKFAACNTNLGFVTSEFFFSHTTENGTINYSRLETTEQHFCMIPLPQPSTRALVLLSLALDHGLLSSNFSAGICSVSTCMYSVLKLMVANFKACEFQIWHWK